MNNIPKAVGICLSLLLFLSGCEYGWQRYVNEDNKFSMLLPASWEKEEGMFNTAVIALSPLKDKKKRVPIRANMNVIAVELPEAADLNVIFDLNKTELASKLATMDDASEGDIYAGRLHGKWLIFEGLLRGYRVKINSAIWVKGKRTYTITCTAPAETFKEYEPTFKKIMRSLRIK